MADSLDQLDQPSWRPADIVRTYIEWSRNGRIVSSQDLADHYNLPVEYIHSMLHNERIAGYVAKNYNVAPPPKYKTRKTLTDRQLRWLGVITNPYSTRTLTGMVKDNDTWMDMEQHRQWMKQGAFLREYKRLISMEVKGTEGEMLRKTAQRAMTGDGKAIELIYRMQGEPLSASIAASAGNMVSLEAVLTAMQRELEPEQMTRVAARLMNPDMPEILELESHEEATAQED